MRVMKLVVLAIFASAGTATALDAQGVTTAALTGVVTGADSVGLEHVTVAVTNTSNGERWQTLTRAGGATRSTCSLSADRTPSTFTPSATPRMSPRA